MRDMQLEAACALNVELRKIQAQNKIKLQVSFPGERTLVVMDGHGRFFASQFGANATIQMNLLRERLGEICKENGLLYA